MGKKIDLNSPRNNSTGINQKKSNHSFSHGLNNQKNISLQNNSSNVDDVKDMKQQNENSAKKSQSYRLPDKVQAVVNFPRKAKIAIPIILAFLPLIFLILFTTLFTEEEEDGGFASGLNGYSYYEGACKLVSVNGEMMDIEEYVARVLPGEVGEFTGETLKAFAVAARTYVIANGPKVGNSQDDCYYNVTQTDDHFQVYSPTTSDTYRGVTQETKGIIITVDGNISGGFYDASCIYTSSQASALDSSGNYNNNNYYIRYGEKTIGGINFQAVPKDKISGIGSLSYYATLAENGSPCSGNHGWGMSQNGAYYLETNDGYSWQQIISYYYNKQEKLMSIYPTNVVSDNWIQTIDTSANSSIPTAIMSKEIRNYISESEYNQVNQDIKNNVVSAGVGTRSAIVAAAVTPIKYFAENYGVVIPYAMGGGHYITITSGGRSINKTTTTYYGLDPDWGANIGGIYVGGYGPYYNYGPDCSSWVPWVFYNAGISMQPRLHEFRYLGTVEDMCGSYIAQPGDILENSHHVTVIVGTDEANRTYYIAHARGGAYGTVITPVDFCDNSYYIVNMGSYIEKNAITDYENRYENGMVSY